MSTLQTAFEYTDTFSGEANYAWCRRLLTGENYSDRGAVRAAKRWAGLTGIPCRKEEYGETIALYPQGCCTVLLINWVDGDLK